MRRIFFIWAFLTFFAVNLYGQVNLVQNPSFELMMACPSYQSPYIESAQYWASYRGTPDYLHSCANNTPVYPNGQPVLGVPNNRGGYQQAKHGDAYAGLYTWCCANGSSTREIMGTILSAYLTVGTKYYFSCYVSNGDSVESNASTNNLGVMLSTIPYNGTPGYTMLITNYSHLHMDSIMNEKDNWIRFSGSIVADSAYRFLAIGNFYNDFYTQVDSTPGVAAPMAYYYIDAVCLTTDSLYSVTWTGIDSPAQEEIIELYPNPAHDYFIMECNADRENIYITDVTGKIMMETELSRGTNRIDTEKFSSGIYFVNSDRRITQKLLVYH